MGENRLGDDLRHELGEAIGLTANVVDGGLDPRAPLNEDRDRVLERLHTIIALVAHLRESDQLEVIRPLLQIDHVPVDVAAPIVRHHGGLRLGSVVLLYGNDAGAEGHQGFLEQGDTPLRLRIAILSRGLRAGELGLPLCVEGIEPAEDFLEGRLDRRIHDSTRALQQGEVRVVGGDLQREGTEPVVSDTSVRSPLTAARI